MPITSSSTPIENIVRDLKLTLPDFDYENVEIETLLRLDMRGDQVLEYDTVLHALTFFDLLGVEIKHRINVDENRLKDVETALAEALRVNKEEKMAETRIKQIVQLDPNYTTVRDGITALEYQAGSVSAVASALNRKLIVMNVLTAKGRAELQAMPT